MATVTINGRTYVGSNISINNGKVFIDGKEANIAESGPQVSIQVVGNLDWISADACEKITVEGDVKGNVLTQSGNIACKDVTGNATTMSGNISCAKVGGDAKTMSGNVMKTA